MWLKVRLLIEVNPPPTRRSPSHGNKAFTAESYSMLNAARLNHASPVQQAEAADHAAALVRSQPDEMSIHGPWGVAGAADVSQ